MKRNFYNIWNFRGQGHHNWLKKCGEKCVALSFMEIWSPMFCNERFSSMTNSLFRAPPPSLKLWKIDSVQSVANFMLSIFQLKSFSCKRVNKRDISWKNIFNSLFCLLEPRVPYSCTNNSKSMVCTKKVYIYNLTCCESKAFYFP